MIDSLNPLDQCCSLCYIASILMANRFEEHKFDQRTIRRSLREGKITQKEWEAYLKSLPDETNKSTPIVVAEETGKKPARAESHKEPTFAMAAET